MDRVTLLLAFLGGAICNRKVPSWNDNMSAISFPEQQRIIASIIDVTADSHYEQLHFSYIHERFTWR